jgi:hypothetical protein
MDTNKLKRFAGEARNILIDGVKQRLSALGIREDGIITEKPELKDGGAVFMSDTQTVGFYDQFESLVTHLEKHSYRDVIEEVAYTWFNRLVAIRIMAKNGLIPPVLEYESEQDRIPVLVSDARQGRMPQMNEESRQKLEALLANDALTDEQFQVLIVAYCHSNPVINKCFGAISDYTELLLPSNILKKDGFIDHLNDDDYISDEDYQSPELIGWLYQFYISEKKDDVFASFKKGKKAEAKDIPAATQIFTPNWIVKYMVQNTVGRIYLDNNPYSDIKDDMKYLVESDGKTEKENVFKFDDIHELTCADLACGSGHILNECFDLLYQCYVEEGYSRLQAVEDIFHYNLTGIDLDTRAKQLSQFALLLKACQKDNSFADAHSMPKVYDMPEPYKDKERLVSNLSKFIMGSNKEAIEELSNAICLMDDAQNLGSIMKFNISERTRNIVAVRMDEYEKENFLSENIAGLMPYMRIILSLTQKYSALVMNPPYMGGGNMNAMLSKYVKDNYEEGKADLATVFVEMMPQILTANGKYAYIIPPSWMFLSTFESLRKGIIEKNKIDSLLHLSRGVFGADFGASAAVISNCKVTEQDKGGVYFRLVERTFQEFEQSHLQLLFEQTLSNHGFRYYFKDYNKSVTELPYSEDGNKIYFEGVSQKNFEKIPGYPIGYWVSENVLSSFDFPSFSRYGKGVKGLDSGDNNTYVRNLWEINNNSTKWVPYCSGGPFRRWYGNYYYVIDYKNVINFSGAYVRNKDSYFKEGFEWSRVSSNHFGVRKVVNAIFGGASQMAFIKSSNLNKFIAIYNTKIVEFYIKFLNPTMITQAGDVNRIPICEKEPPELNKYVNNNISISRQDWDAHETSWDFQTNEIVQLSKDGLGNITAEIEGLNVLNYFSLKLLIIEYKAKWEGKFNQLHANEEELNRQFIDIYGLQDELTPDVPFDEITILQQGEVSIEDNAIVWHDDVLMKQLVSYAVGCMMGRYSIDKPGLILANQGDGQKEYEAVVPNSRFEIDDDGIIPIMPANTEFTDNITLRFKTWLSITFGEDSLVENLNYIEKSLGKRLDDYFVKDFWKDHKKMYQNRPIYWLFSSKKGAFQCIVYMHRMNAYTAEKVRTNYLLPHIEWLLTKQSEMQANAANLSTRERKELDAIGKQIEECREYHDRLHAVADQQIAFDLDDGVVVNYAKFGNILMKLK